MIYDVSTAKFTGTYKEEILSVVAGRALVSVKPESLSIVFISAIELGNVLLPIIEPEDARLKLPNSTSSSRTNPLLNILYVLIVLPILIPFIACIKNRRRRRDLK